jgi:hypothetical protein
MNGKLKGLRMNGNLHTTTQQQNRFLLPLRGLQHSQQNVASYKAQSSKR